MGSAGVMVGNIGRKKKSVDGAMSCNSETSKYSPQRNPSFIKRNQPSTLANGPVKVKDSLKGSTLRTRARKP